MQKQQLKLNISPLIQTQPNSPQRFQGFSEDCYNQDLKQLMQDLKTGKGQLMDTQRNYGQLRDSFKKISSTSMKYSQDLGEICKVKCNFTSAGSVLNEKLRIFIENMASQIQIFGKIFSIEQYKLKEKEKILKLHLESIDQSIKEGQNCILKAQKELSENQKKIEKKKQSGKVTPIDAKGILETNMSYNLFDSEKNSQDIIKLLQDKLTHQKQNYIVKIQDLSQQINQDLGNYLQKMTDCIKNSVQSVHSSLETIQKTAKSFLQNGLFSEQEIQNGVLKKINRQQSLLSGQSSIASINALKGYDSISTHNKNNNQIKKNGRSFSINNLQGLNLSNNNNYVTPTNQSTQQEPILFKRPQSTQNPNQQITNQQLAQKLMGCVNSTAISPINKHFFQQQNLYNNLDAREVTGKKSKCPSEINPLLQSNSINQMTLREGSRQNLLDQTNDQLFSIPQQKQDVQQLQQNGNAVNVNIINSKIQVNNVYESPSPQKKKNEPDSINTCKSQILINTEEASHYLVKGQQNNLENVLEKYKNKEGFKESPMKNKRSYSTNLQAQNLQQNTQKSINLIPVQDESLHIPKFLSQNNSSAQQYNNNNCSKLSVQQTVNKQHMGLQQLDSSKNNSIQTQTVQQQQQQQSLTYRGDQINQSRKLSLENNNNIINNNLVSQKYQQIQQSQDFNLLLPATHQHQQQINQFSNNYNNNTLKGVEVMPMTQRNKQDNSTTNNNQQLQQQQQVYQSYNQQGYSHRLQQQKLMQNQNKSLQYLNSLAGFNGTNLSQQQQSITSQQQQSVNADSVQVEQPIKLSQGFDKLYQQTMQSKMNK